MYRINSVLNKPSLLSPRYNSSQTRKFLADNCQVTRTNINHGRQMSTTKANKAADRKYWAYSAAGAIVFGTSITLISKYNEGFRHTVEWGFPGSAKLFNYLIPREPPAILKGAEGTLPEEEEEILVVNIMDTPTPSAIDIEVGSKHEAAADIEVEDNEPVAEIEVADEQEAETSIVDELLEKGEQFVEEKIHEFEEEALELVEQEALELVEEVVEAVVDVESPAVAAVLEVVEEIAETPEVQQVISDTEEAVIHYVEEKVVDFAEAVLIPNDPIAETPVVEEVVVNHREKLSVVLTNLYENLRIILDDTVTSKTSAAGMLHGYITQFGQALLISKEDPAYDSIWEAAAVLEQNVKESIELVKAKEAEAKAQIDKVMQLISDARKVGLDDIAERADTLVASSSESLSWGESEIEAAQNKLNFLQEFQKRVEASPKLLQDYLEDFKPDLIRLLNLQKIIGDQNLTVDDALLMLSLKRPELIYAEVQEKEIEQQKQFESTLGQQKEDLLKEADENLKNMMQTLETNKENELKSKVEELNEIHENHLKEELGIQAEVNQQEREAALTKNTEELTSKHEEEMAQKLDDKEKEHYHVVSKNLSSLKGIQSKLNEVVELGTDQQRSQHLWVAAQAFTIALNDVSDNGRTRNLIPALSNLIEYSQGDDVLATIIAGVPKGAADLGVIPEDALVQRFHDVKRNCMRVAAVKTDGSILAYTFSYIKSFFVYTRGYQKRITDDIDIESIGPYEILEKADYYMQQGDLVQAAKLISLLKGVPRKLSADWLNEVRLLLETKQSVNLLMAYAGSFVAGTE